MRFCNIKKTSRTSLHSHADEIVKLVQVAYDEHRADIATERFFGMLSYVPLQRHLLAISLTEIQSAVHAGNEYLQIQPGFIEIQNIESG